MKEGEDAAAGNTAPEGASEAEKTEQEFKEMCTSAADTIGGKLFAQVSDFVQALRALAEKGSKDCEAACKLAETGNVLAASANGVQSIIGDIDQIHILEAHSEEIKALGDIGNIFRVDGSTRSAAASAELLVALSLAAAFGGRRRRP
jgi:hypothetical protein